MTSYRCVGCGYKFESVDSKPDEIKGLCTDCYARDPGLAQKVTAKPHRERAFDWRRY